MNQVSRMIRADNGEYLAFTGLNYNKNTQAQFQKARYEEVQRYFAPYLKHNKIIKKDAGARMYLSDGGEIQVQGGSCFDITYDINGSQKPNKYGIDKYLFIMCGAENIRFYWQGSFPTKPKTRAEFVQKCKTATSAQYYYCIGLLELDKWKIYEDNTWNFK